MSKGISPIDVIFSRNYGFWSEQEQERLASVRVALVGAGGDGFQLGQDLIQMGVRQIRVADPETFDRSNMNRVPYVSVADLGVNKAKVFRNYALGKAVRADEIEIEVFDDGVTEANIAAMLTDVDLVIDESELTYPHIGTMVAREARRRGIASLMVMNVGFAGLGTSFAPHSKYTFERIMGLPEGAPLDEIRDMEVNFSRCVPYLPSYGDLESLISVQRGASFPGNKVGVNVAAGIGASEAFLHLVGGRNRRKHPTWAPRWRWMDAYSNRSGTVRFAPLGYYKSALALSIRSRLGLNPKCSYSLEDLSRRQGM